MNGRRAASASTQRGGFDTSVRDKAIRDRRCRLAAEQARLLKGVQQVLLELREPLGVRSAYIVGSVLSPGRWTESSDVDVAVGGCSHAVLDVMKELEDATGKTVDVIDLDRHPAPESFIRCGVRVYG